MEIDYGLTVEPITRSSTGGRWMDNYYGMTPRDHTRALIKHIAEANGVTFEAVMSDSRVSKIAHARQEAMYRLREMGFSLPHIGMIFNRDHTTVLHGVRRHQERIRDRS